MTRTTVPLRRLAATVLAVLPVMAAADSSPRMQPVNPPGPAIPGISQAMIVPAAGRLMFLSGQVPLDARGEMAEDLEGQLNQAFANMQATLAAAGTDFSALARVTLYIKDYDASQLPQLRAVRERWITSETPPASALIGVDALFVPQALVEIDAVAVLPDRP